MLTMKRNPNFALRATMLVADIMAVIVAFAIAYYSRVYLDPRPFYFTPEIWTFLRAIVLLLPIWVLILFISGVYRESVYLYRPRVYWRMLVVSLLGIMCIITAGFLLEDPIFPSRIIVLYAFILTYILLIIEREVIRFARKIMLRRGSGALSTIIVGDDLNTAVLLEQFENNPEFGYKVVAVVARKEFLPESAYDIKYRSLSAVLKTVAADTIIQTDDKNTEKIYSQAVDHHMNYLYVPNQEILLSHTGEIHIIGTQPMIGVRTTPLIGWARFIKRSSDIIVGGFFFILAMPLILIIAIISKISDPKGTVFYSEKRLTRFGQKRSIYKFRTHKAEYSGLTPEQAFEKMGRPELIKEYRDNGDQLDEDPRVTTIGKFLRATSLDELPQLWNVVKGDISLVGPRALQPGELEKYPNRNLILSAKSGLTGLAQVSGRRDISFEERRSLDIYYIQNWSLALDTQIIFRTILMVLIRRGAK